jgi:hypothetical protein
MSTLMPRRLISKSKYSPRSTTHQHVSQQPINTTLSRSFYTLSKTHHPDHNPGNPHAPRRFMRISEAYSVLSHAEKRARYDRDVMRRRHNHPPKHPPHSYHSTGPAGGRPASGLSRRRGTFTGPPPSFFRSGGWGNHSAKRKAAHEETTGTGGDTGGMGPGADPLHRTGRTPGFDSERHEAQHRRVQEHMARRRGAEIPLVDTGLLFRFMVVAGIISAVAYIPYWVMGVGEGKQGRKKKEA